MEAARHHRRNEVRGQPLHDLVARRDAGDEVPSRGPRRFGRDEAAGDDAGARMRQHAEGVPLAAGHRHLRVGERGATLRHPGAAHHDGGAVAHAGFFFRDELHGLPAARCLGAEEDRGEAMERHPLGAIDHRGRQILMAQTHDPLRKLPAERCHRFLPLPS